MGGSGLSFGNIRWLAQGDLAQSYLGWAFYRHDRWMLPFGASPSYGLEFHASVLYSDSVPLLAMPFKLLAAWLPEPFQYFGVWLLACFMLQAWFAWRLLGLATENRWAKACGLVFFVLAPPMLQRLGGHLALFAHWPLLAALYLYLRGSLQGRRSMVAWLTLVPLSFLIHAYVFLMVAGIWAADVLRRILEDRRAGNAGWAAVPLKEIVLVPALTSAVAWLAGFFLVPGKSAQADGYGFYKMNLLAPFNGGGWSALGWNAPTGGAGEYEGFNYLGLGGIGLCVAAALLWLFARRRADERPAIRWPLWTLAVVFTLLAITNTIGFGQAQWHLSLPFGLEMRLAHSPVQATGRLFWVMYYLLLATAFFVLARALRPRMLVAALAVLAVLQAVDIQAGVRNLRAMQLARAEQAAGVSLTGGFWDDAATRYRRLRLLPTRVLAPGWEPLAFYAQRHGMGTDAVQLARVDWKSFNRARTAQRIGLLKGRPEDGTLYVVDEPYTDLADIAARSSDALFKLDGYRVYAPGWTGTLPAGAKDLRGSARHAGSVLSLPFASGVGEGMPAQPLLGEGWRQEVNRAGMEGARATLFVPRDKDRMLVLDFHAIDQAEANGLRIEALMGDLPLAACTWSDGSCRQLRLLISAGTETRGFHEIVLRTTPASERRRPVIALDKLSLEAPAQGAMARKAEAVSAPLTAVR